MKTIEKIIIILSFLFSASFLNAQTDSLLLKELSKPIVTCEIVSVNAQRIITSLDISQTDSLNKVLSIWEQFCGKNEVITRMKILVGIYERKNTDDLIEYYFSDYLFSKLEYRYNISEESMRFNSLSYFDYIEPGGDFDFMTKKVAANLLLLQEKGSLEYLFCEYAAGNFDRFREDLNMPEYRQDERLKNISYMRKRQYNPGYVKFFSGVFVPDVKLDEYFNTTLNAGFGIVTPKFFKKSFNVELLVNIRPFFKTVHFDFSADDSLYTASSDIAFNFGINTVYEKEISNKTFFRAFTGIGFENLNTGIETRESIEKNDPENRTYYNISTYSIPVGTGIKRYFNDIMFVGADLYYKYSPYTVDKKLITPLKGDSYIFNLSFGIVIQ